MIGGLFGGLLAGRLGRSRRRPLKPLLGALLLSAGAAAHAQAPAAGASKRPVTAPSPPLAVPTDPQAWIDPMGTLTVPPALVQQLGPSCGLPRWGLTDAGAVPMPELGILSLKVWPRLSALPAGYTGCQWVYSDEPRSEPAVALIVHGYRAGRLVLEMNLAVALERSSETQDLTPRPCLYADDRLVGPSGGHCLESTPQPLASFTAACTAQVIAQKLDFSRCELDAPRPAGVLKAPTPARVSLCAAGTPYARSRLEGGPARWDPRDWLLRQPSLGLPAFQALLGAGYPLDRAVRGNSGLVHAAVWSGRLDQLDALAAAGAPLDVPDDKGLTPLGLALIVPAGRYRHADPVAEPGVASPQTIARRLLDLGARGDRRVVLDEQDLSLRELAERQGWTDVAQRLPAVPVDAAQRQRAQRCTP